jgi:hypothetical protein
MAIPLPSAPIDARRGFLLLAVAAIIVGGIVAYQAISNEITGEAIYYKRTGLKSSVAVHITRESDPSKFRSVTNFRWGVSLICLSVAVVGFTFYRKLDDCG